VFYSGKSATSSCQRNNRLSLLLITHQINISSLTKIYPSSGELVIVMRYQSGEILIHGTIETDRKETAPRKNPNPLATPKQQ
jgi:hypothetical protein